MAELDAEQEVNTHRSLASRASSTGQAFGALGRALSSKKVAPTNYDANWEMPGAIAQEGGIKTHYQLTGTKTGRLVILLHAMGTYSVVWDDLAAQLEEAGFLVLRYDMLGCGFSGKAPVRVYTIKNLIKQLELLLTSLGLTARPYDIVAHSTGASLAVHFAHGHPKAQGICFISPTGLCDVIRAGICSCFWGGDSGAIPEIGSDVDMWKRTFYMPEGQEALEFCGMQHAMFANNPEAKDAVHSALDHMETSGCEDHLASLMTRIGRRVMLIWGQYDSVLPMNLLMPRWKKIMDGGVGVVQYEVVDRAGHMCMMEKKQVVTNLVLKWLLARPRRKASIVGTWGQPGGGALQSLAPGERYSAFDKAAGDYSPESAVRDDKLSTRRSAELDQHDSDKT